MATINHVHVLTMGGTIDKDYPRLTSGYAFEFGDEAAASRILNAHPNLGITFDVTSICKKDSLEVSDNDRKLLSDAILKMMTKKTSYCPPTRIVVTHGTDTMIETAKYVERKLNYGGHRRQEDLVSIAFTGATKPERFVDSDASFNVGLAVGATSSPIAECCVVYICMNGNIIPANQCERDEDTGLFKCK